ncbi:hypothetical protein L208DRAFT_1381646 [Tricholoma matsutake]|nr:hypothetical protein L208DRAFT_1381646 [Tricholoma matsutake 945]
MYQAAAETKQWTQRNAYDFTGCLTHIKITERLSDGEITRIIGHFMHNDLCEKAVLKRLPAIPLHEHVYEVALAQLEDGAKCMINAVTDDHQQKLGVDVQKAPQYNIDNWLNPASKDFKPEIHNAIFHYAVQSEGGEQFEGSRCGATEFWKDHVQNQLQSIEEGLIASVDHGTALALISHQYAIFEQLASDTISSTARKAGISHLDYLSENWMPVNINRQAHKAYAEWLTTQFSGHAGGTNLVKARKLNPLDGLGLGVHGLCWWTTDTSQDVEAKKAHQEKEFVFPVSPPQSHEIIQSYFSGSTIPNGHSAPLLLPMPVHVEMDLSIIQALATTLNCSEEDPVMSELLDTDEDESIGSSESGLADGGSQPLPSHIPQADAPISTSSSKSPHPINADHHSAIVQQVQQCVQYEIRHLLPGLHGLQNLVADTPELRSVKDIHELCQVLQLLSTQLKTIEPAELLTPASVTQSQTPVQGREVLQK